MFPTAIVGGRNSAYVTGTVTVNASDLEVSADGTHIADADSVSIGIGVAAGGAGGGGRAEVSRITEAYVGSAVGAPRTVGVITIGTGEIVIDADSNSTAEVDVQGGAGAAGISVAAMVATAAISAVTRAYVGEGALVTAGEVDVTADAIEFADADAVPVSVALASVSVGKADAIITSETAAFAGTPNGWTPAASPTTTITLTAGGDADGTLTITATTNAHALAEAQGGSAGGLTVGVMLATATVGSTTRAYVGEGTTIDAADLVLTADGVSLLAEATSLAIGIGAGHRKRCRVDGDRLRPRRGLHRRQRRRRGVDHADHRRHRHRQPHRRRRRLHAGRRRGQHRGLRRRHRRAGRPAHRHRHRHDPRLRA